MRGAGEPALLAGLVSEVARTHGVDQRRIFVAGLSAGAAMAVVLGETYPELFAGIGAHSGLPYAQRPRHPVGDGGDEGRAQRPAGAEDHRARFRSRPAGRPGRRCR